MLDIKFIRENRDAVVNATRVKGVLLDVDALLDADKSVVQFKQQIQVLLEEKNATSSQIAKSAADVRTELIEKGKELGRQIDILKPKLNHAEEKLKALLWLVPNIPAPDAPIGKNEDENVVRRECGKRPDFSFKPLDHVELLEKNGWAELERIAKVAGSRSYALAGEMVLLEMAILRLALDVLKQKKFRLLAVPSLAREFSLYGTGHFPTGRDQVYQIPSDELFLSGTAEVQCNALHSGEILKEADLPILYGGFSPCFRREAGSAGRDVRGLIRVHQFYKVEQYVICKSEVEESARWHKTLLGTAEELLALLELPYRVVEVCTGDMGPGKFRMHDIETWIPSEKKYRETHSCSELHDWQARRTDLRYRDAQGKVRYCFTLNNTAVATPRILVAFLENHQTAERRVRIPKALSPYLGGVSELPEE